MASGNKARLYNSDLDRSSNKSRLGIKSPYRLAELLEKALRARSYEAALWIAIRLAKESKQASVSSPAAP